MSMNILDNLSKIQKLDKSNMLGSIHQLLNQCKQTNEELKNVIIPPSYRNVNKIVINGMGGSRLGARVAQRLFEDKLKIPLLPIGSYTLPNFVDDKTLLILSSYSGNTEEIVASYSQAVKKKAKIMIFSQGGKLAELARKNKLPGFFDFEPKYNPCNQPRTGLGYQILAIILLLGKSGLLKINREEIGRLLKFLPLVRKKYDVPIPFENNLAKKVAWQIQGKIPILVGCEFLMGVAHVWKNQLNENAKHFAILHEIPELNHHLLEGLAFPKGNKENLIFIFIKSGLFHPKNQKRIEVTKKVVDGYKIDHLEFKLEGKTKLGQTFELVQFGSFVSFYLAISNNLDPTPIPWVDFFKKELGKKGVFP